MKAQPVSRLQYIFSSRKTVIGIGLILFSIIVTIILIPILTPFFAVQFAPEKIAQASQSDLAKQASFTFWENFHAGNYDKIPDIRFLLTAAYVENPNDPQIALLLAHTHLWSLAERDREAQDPLITDHAILAERYFSEAARLTPEDARIPGWLGSVKLALGSIHQDEKATREGYFMLKEAVELWPEFNNFTAGFAVSGLAADSDIYQEGLAYQWHNIDVCIESTGESIDRTHPDYSSYLVLETTTGPKRTCWNSTIAPHNFEGFFLNMGDMLLKNGDTEAATHIYQIAQLSPDYDSWPYKSVLEARLTNLDSLAQQFLTADLESQPEIMFNSSYNCMACHQK